MPQDYGMNWNSIIISEKVGRIILGLPLNFEGEDTQKTREVRAFGEELTRRVDIPWEFYDESFTSQDANQSLKNNGL